MARFSFRKPVDRKPKRIRSDPCSRKKNGKKEGWGNVIQKLIAYFFALLLFFYSVEVSYFQDKPTTIDFFLPSWFTNSRLNKTIRLVADREMETREIV